MRRQVTKMKRRKCRTCGKRFEIAKAKTYTVAVHNGRVGFGMKLETRDAIDCPVCGRQAVLAIRHPRKLNVAGGDDFESTTYPRP